MANDKPKKEISKAVAKGKLDKSASDGDGINWKDAFFAGSGKNIKNSIVKDIILPALQETFVTALETSIEMLVFGERRGKNGRGMFNSGLNNRTNYNVISTTTARQSSAQDYRSAYNYGQSSPSIVFETRYEADEVIEAMKMIFMDYPTATVKDLLIAADIEPDVMDGKYGWNRDEFDDFYVKRRISDGNYMVMTPKPHMLKY